MIEVKNEKIKTLLYNILDMCEKQGLTESEVKELPELLRIEIRDIFANKAKSNVFHR